MALTVEWSDEADLGLDDVLDYLEREWTILEILSLENKIGEKLNQISKYPFSCVAASDDATLRKAVIDKNNFIVYRVNNEKNLIRIVSFSSTSQE